MYILSAYVLKLHENDLCIIITYLLTIMAIPVVDFSKEDTKLERFLIKNQL